MINLWSPLTNFFWVSIKTYQKILLLLSITLYLASLFYPAFGCTFLDVSSGNYLVEKGYKILFIGWAGILELSIAWFANITYFLTLFFASCFRQKNLIPWCWINLMLGLSSLLLYFNQDHKPQLKIYIGFYNGFYLWIASFLILLLYAYVARLKLKPLPASF